MNKTILEKRIQEVIHNELPFFRQNEGIARLNQLFEIGREDLTLAKLAEAHWDAISILDEKGRKPYNNAFYGVWASEIPGQPLQLNKTGMGWSLSGVKMFCSGASIVDRALITASGFLIDLEIPKNSSDTIQIVNQTWVINGFKETNTATVTFNEAAVKKEDIIGEEDWYLKRPGFWHGALGPAACWGGGACGLLDYALKNKRNDPHTLAHLGAMNANIWGIKALLESAGKEINSDLHNIVHAQQLALQTRHLIEQFCTDTLRRFARAYGPFPLACDVSISRRYQELDIFLRQNHAERDLECLGKILKQQVVDN